LLKIEFSVCGAPVYVRNPYTWWKSVLFVHDVHQVLVRNDLKFFPQPTGVQWRRHAKFRMFPNSLARPKFIALFSCRKFNECNENSKTTPKIVGFLHGASNGVYYSWKKFQLQNIVKNWVQCVWGACLRSKPLHLVKEYIVCTRYASGFGCNDLTLLPHPTGVQWRSLAKFRTFPYSLARPKFYCPF
jgi:hypothetical protein